MITFGNIVGVQSVSAKVRFESFDPYAPLGGYKRCGADHENGQEAINAYLQTKTMWIDALGKAANPLIIR